MKKFKDIKAIKTNPEPAKGKNVDPGQLGQYSAKHQVSESTSLNQYLSSRGINPKFVSTATKIAHSKSALFIKWKQDHMQSMQRREETVLEANKPSALDRFRAAAAAREIKHNNIEKDRQERLHKEPSASNLPHRDVKKDGMSDAISRLEKHMNKEEVELDEASKDNPRHPMHQSDPSLYKKTAKSMTKQYATHAGKFFSNKDTMDFTLDYKKTNKEAPRYKNEEVELAEEQLLDEMINEVLGKDASAGDWIHDFVHSDNPKFAGKSKAERKKMALGAYYGKQNEEFEQLDELKKSTVFSWLKQQPVVPVRKPNSDRVSYNQKVKNHSKSWNRALDRLSGYKPTSEDMWQDTQAATQTPADGANGGNELAERKRQMSKSARMIKALYKRKGVVKEDMYDHEKEDKSVATYGKKPKMSQTDKKDSLGENKPQAAATLTGGTTLTGVKRDSIEIDPIMRNRPGQPDISKKSDKKENNKNDK
jgi:hypothetical protein